MKLVVQVNNKEKGIILLSDGEGSMIALRGKEEVRFFNKAIDLNIMLRDESFDADTEMIFEENCQVVDDCASEFEYLAGREIMQKTDFYVAINKYKAYLKRRIEDILKYERAIEDLKNRLGYLLGESIANE